MAEEIPTPADTPVVDKAKRILVDRKGWSSDEALIALTTAAHGNELTIDELAECLVADQDLRPLAGVARPSPSTARVASAPPPDDAGLSARQATASCRRGRA
jgi:hypothetical protein